MSKFSITAFLGLKSDQFKKGLSDARSKQKPIMQKMGAAFSKVGPMLGAAVVAGAAVATAAVAKFAKDSLMEFASFEKGMKEVYTLMPGISKEAMGKMEDDVLKLSKEMGKLPEEVVPALYQAISAGVPQENVMTFLEVASKASIGGVTSLETAVDGLTGVINAYGKENMTAAKASDIMFTAVKLGKTTFEEMSASLGDVTPLASALGVTFEEVSAALATSTGITGNTAKSVTGLKNMMAELGKKGQVAAKNFEAIAGKSFPEFIKGGGSMQDALKLMKAHADKTGGSIMDLFGGIEAGQAALQLTESGAKAFGEALTEMGNSAGASAKAFETMDSGVLRSFDKIKASIKAAMIKIGGAIAPILDAIVPAIQMLADNLGDLPWKELGAEVAKMAQDFKPIFDEMANAGKAGFKALMPVFKIIMRLLAGKAKSDSGMMLTFVKIFVKILQVIEPFLNAILKVMDAMDATKKKAGPLGKAIGFLTSPFKLMMLPLMPLILAFKGLRWIWGKFTTALGPGGRKLLSIGNIFKLLKAAILRNIATVMGAMEFLFNAVKNSFSNGRKVIKKAIDVIWGIFKKLFPNISGLITALIDLFKKGMGIMLEPVKKFAGLAKELISKFIGKAIELFKMLFPNVSAVIGKVVGVVKGGVDKIRGAWSAMTGKLGGWWTSLKNKVTGESEEMARQVSEDCSKAAEASTEAAKKSVAESGAAMKGGLQGLKEFGSKLAKSAKGLMEDQTKAMQATLIKMGANAQQVMKLNGEELQQIFEKTGEKGKAVMAEYQEANAKQINLMKQALEKLGVKQSELVGKSNEEIRRLWISTGEKGQAAYNGVIAKEKQLQAEQAAGAKSQVENQIAAANANVAAATKQANAMKPVVNAAKLSTEAVKKIGPAIEAATPPTEAYAKAIVEAAHAEDKLVARLAVQIQQGTIRMKNAAMYNMITTGTMKVMGVHLAQLRYGILYTYRMSQFAEAYAKALKSVGPELKDLAKLSEVLEKGKFSIDLIAKGLKFTGLLVSMDTSLKSIDKSLKGKFVNQ